MFSEDKKPSTARLDAPAGASADDASSLRGLSPDIGDPIDPRAEDANLVGSVDDLLQDRHDLADIDQIPEVRPIAASSREHRRYYYIKVAKLLSAVVCFAGIVGAYIGFLLFGNKSVEVILDLMKLKAELNESILQSRDENAKLHKRLLELRKLDSE